MADFAYLPDTIEESAEFAVSRVRFGDGYVQRISTGINNGLRTWNLSFNDRDLTEANAIRDFFVLKSGAVSFTWRPQGFTADVKVICSSYSRPLQNRFKGGSFVYQIQAKFEEVPL